jgi:hypothetical protein
MHFVLLELHTSKIDATGAITVLAFDTSLAHYKQYTLPGALNRAL